MALASPPQRPATSSSAINNARSCSITSSSISMPTNHGKDGGVLDARNNNGGGVRSVRVPSRSATVVDGSTPFAAHGYIPMDRSDMEMHPRPVDIPVTRPLGEFAPGRHSQIETAVKELLSQITKS